MIIQTSPVSFQLHNLQILINMANLNVKKVKMFAFTPPSNFDGFPPYPRVRGRHNPFFLHQMTTKDIKEITYMY